MRGRQHEPAGDSGLAAAIARDPASPVIVEGRGQLGCSDRSLERLGRRLGRARPARRDGRRRRLEPRDRGGQSVRTQALLVGATDGGAPPAHRHRRRRGRRSPSRVPGCPVRHELILLDERHRALKPDGRPRAVGRPVSCRTAPHAAAVTRRADSGTRSWPRPVGPVPSVADSAHLLARWPSVRIRGTRGDGIRAGRCRACAGAAPRAWCAACQPGDDLAAGLGRVDHVVDVAALGGGVRVGVLLGVLGDELGPPGDGSAACCSSRR